jgi:4-amino-4-deoxy-L-arabinose transferase-like glycosyltransferase
LISLPRPSASARTAGVLIVLALAPLWLTGMFGRGLWTPDEPREADIAWRMSLQSDRTLPQLAGAPFLEKPPLSYWMSAAASSVLGDNAAALRAPNLLYALVAALAVGALALRMQARAAAAVIAALTSLSALLVLRVSLWLAPDAALLTGCALALLGAWRGYRAAPGLAKAAGYALMHLGAAIGFMAKSAPGWLVPALALLTLIVWERRWSELVRWELYAGLILQGLIIGPWLWAVTRSPLGSAALRALFWNNVVGRFTQVAAPAALDYTSGHRNSPGKYLLELPVYLMPWTLLVAAALVRAWQRLRARQPQDTAWRFAVAASLPFLLLLSCAATARDIYAAPALLGMGVLVGLWTDAAEATSRLDAVAVRITRWLVTAIALLLASALALFAAAGAAAPLGSALAALALLGVACWALLRGGRAQQAGSLRVSVAWSYASYAAAVSLSALVAFPVIDRWQDLPAIAQRIHADTRHEPLALLDPDETTIAMLDHGLHTPFTALSSDAADPAQVVGDWFSAHGATARVLVLLPGHAPGPVTRWLGYTAAPADDGAAGRLLATGAAALAQRYELPQGRRYALLAPPP